MDFFLQIPVEPVCYAHVFHVATCIYTHCTCTCTCISVFPYTVCNPEDLLVELPSDSGTWSPLIFGETGYSFFIGGNVTFNIV